MSNNNTKPKSGLDPEVLQKAQENAEKYMKRTNDIADDLTDKYKEIERLEKSITNLRGQQLKDAQKALAQKTKELSQSEEILKITEDIADSFKEQSDAYDNILDAKLDATSIDKQIVQLQKKQLSAIQSGNKEAVDAYEIAIEQQLAYKAQLPYLQKVQGTFSQINTIAQDLATEISGAFNNLPGGKYLSKMLGLDKLGDAFKNSVNAAGKAFIESGGSISAATKAFGSSLTMLLNPITLIAAALAGMFLILSNITKQAREFSTQTGLSVAASQKLVEQSISIQSSIDNQLSSQKDILSVQQQTISQLGTMGKLSGDVALQVSETGNAFGYGAEMAGQVQAQMMQISGMSETAAADAQDFAAQLALAEGVAPAAVMKDIAKSAGVANKYFFGNAKALGKAAVEAQKMGMTLDDMAKTSEALLNIEESLTNQYQLSAMLGRQVNLDKARQLAAEGNIVEATRETIKALGGVQEFERASTFEKERMAAAAGMTVEQLGKSLAIQEKMTNATEEELAAMNGLNLSASEIKNMSAEDLKSKLASQQATEQLSTSFEKIKSSLTTAILPIAKVLVPLFQVLGTTIELAFLPFKWAKEILTYIVDKAREFSVLSSILVGSATLIYALYQKTAIEAGIIAVKSAATAIAQETIAFFQNFSLKSLIQQGIAMAVNLGTAIATAVAQISGMSAATLGVAAAIALAAGATAYAFLNSKEDDMVMSPTGPTGYSRILSGPEGAVALNDKDTVVSGTNLSGGGGGTSVIDQSSINAIVGAIQNLRIIIDESAVNAIAQKGAVRASFK